MNQTQKEQTDHSKMMLLFCSFWVIIHILKLYEMSVTLLDLLVQHLIIDKILCSATLQTLYCLNNAFIWHQWCRLHWAISLLVFITVLEALLTDQKYLKTFATMLGKGLPFILMVPFSLLDNLLQIGINWQHYYL